MNEYLKENWYKLTDEQRQEIRDIDYRMRCVAINIDILNYQKAELIKKGYKFVDIPSPIVNFYEDKEK